MKIAFAVTVAASFLLAGRHSSAVGAEGLHRKLAPDDLAQVDPALADAVTRSLGPAIVVPEEQPAAGTRVGGGVRGLGGGNGNGGGHRSLACVPSFTGEYSQTNTAEIGIGPIGADKKLMKTSPPGSGRPANYSWYSPAPNTNPFFICNKQYQTVFPGMVGYTFRAFSNVGNSSGCREEGDFYVILKLYDVANKKVLRRQREMSGPYMLYGNKAPVPPIPHQTEVGSTLLPNGLYQVSATMHLMNGTQVDKTDFGADIMVVSC
jgi:hypothetical protein